MCLSAISGQKGTHGGVDQHIWHLLILGSLRPTASRSYPLSLFRHDHTESPKENWDHSIPLIVLAEMTLRAYIGERLPTVSSLLRMSASARAPSLACNQACA